MTRGVLFWFLPILFLSCFSAYLLTLGPAFQPDDSAETIAACVTLTPQHPSGYPLYTILGHLFSFIPIGNPAFRMNLLAALLGSLLVMFVGVLFLRMDPFDHPSKISREWVPVLLPALGGALVLALSKSYWIQCISAKGGIYLLQGIVFLGLILWMEKWDPSTGRRPMGKDFFLLGFFLGLGFANGTEMQSIFALSAFLFWISKKKVNFHEARRPWKDSLFLLTLMVVGLSLYLFLPLRALSGPFQLVWGDLRTFHGYLEFMAFSDVRQEMGSKIGQNLIHLDLQKTAWIGALKQLPLLTSQWNRISDHLLTDLGPFALLPLVSGLAGFLRRKSPAVLFLGLVTTMTLILLNGLVFLWPKENYWAIDKFLLVTNIFFALCVGAGLQRWAARTDGFSPFKAIEDRRTFLGSVILVCLIFPAYSLLAHWRICDESRQTWDYDHGEDLLGSLQRSSVFVAEGDDPIFSVHYFQQVLGQRKDITLVPAYYLWSTWGGKRVEKNLPGMKWDQARFGSLSTGERVDYAMTRILDPLTQGRPVQVSANLDLLNRCYFALQPIVRTTGDLFSLLTPYGFSFFCGEGSAEKGFELLDRSRERGSAQDRSSASGAMDILFDMRAQSYFNAAQYCSQKGLVDRADRYFSSAIEEARAPTLQARIWMGRGDLFFSQKKAVLALSAYQNSAALDPDPASFSRLVRSLLALGKYPEALAEAQRSIEAYSGDETSWRSLAACEAAMGDRGKAQEAFQKAVELGGR